MSRSCTIAISRPPLAPEGTLRVGRRRDVALCTFEAAFRTRPHAPRYAYTWCGLNRLHAVCATRKMPLCIKTWVACTAWGHLCTTLCGSHMVMTPRKRVSHPTYKGRPSLSGFCRFPRGRVTGMEDPSAFFSLPPGPSGLPAPPEGVPLA